MADLSRRRRRVLQPFLRGHSAHPTQERIGLEAEAVVGEIKTIPHHNRGLGQVEISRLAGGMEGHTPLIPTGQLGDGRIHDLVDRAHAHQVKDRHLHQRSQPKRQPVVAEVQDDIDGLLQGPLPEPGQQALGWHPNVGGPGGVLATLLGGAGFQQQGGPLTTGVQARALSRGHRQAMAALEKPTHHAHQGELHAPGLATAQGPQGGSDHQDREGACTHAVTSCSSCQSWVRRLIKTTLKSARAAPNHCKGVNVS